MATTDDLNQNITFLTQAVQALNNNMFMSAGGRPGILGTGGLAGGGTLGATRPGQGVNSQGDPHKDSIKLAASNTLLEKRLKETNDTMKYLVTNQKENIKNLNQYTATAGKYFEGFLTKFSSKQLDKEIPEKLTNLLSDSIKSGLIEPLRSFEDVMRLNKRMQTDTIDEYVRLQTELEQLGEQTTANAGSFKTLNERILQTGWDTDSFRTALNACDGDVNKLKQSFGGVASKMAGQAVASDQATIATNKLAAAFNVFKGIALTVGSVYLNSARAAAQYATTFSSPLLATAKAAAAGLNPEELAKAQHEQWQALHSSNISMDEFQDKLVKGSWNLLQFTGSLSDGARLTSSFIGNFRTLSDNTSRQNDFMDQQASLFKDLNRTFSVTTEQFSDLNTQLMNNGGVQASLYKLDKDRRVVLFQSLQGEYQQLRAYGLLDDQAKKVVSTLAEMTGGTAVSRIQKAAQLRATGGIAGLSGGESEELFRLQSFGARNPGDQARLAQLMTRAQRGVAGQYQQSSRTGNLGQEAALDALFNQGGIAQEFGPNSSLAALATSQGRQISKSQQAQLASTSYLGGNVGDQAITTAALGIQDVMRTTAGDIVKAIWGAAAAYGAGKLLTGGVGKVLGAGRLGGGAGGWLGRILGTGAGAAEGAGAGAAAGLGGMGLLGSSAAVLGAGALGYGAGTAINSIPKLWGGNGIGESIGGAVFDWTHPNAATSQVSHINYNQQLKQQLNDREESVKQQGGDNQEMIDHLEAIKTQLGALHAKLDKDSPLAQELKKLNIEVKRGNDMSVVQTDEHIEATKKIVEQKDTFRLPSRQ